MPERDEEEFYCRLPMEDLFFLQKIPGIGIKTLFKMIKSLKEENCVDLWTACGEKAITESLQENQREFFRDYYKRGPEENRNHYREWIKKGYRFIPYFSKEYPKRLKGLEDAPFSLWVKGHMTEENRPSVAIIGARQCSEYGRKAAYQFGRELSECGVSVISGMARGIDGYAQRGALDGEGASYAVLGCGADYCYPAENRDIYERITERGGVISEYAMGTKPESRLFPARNRIISGLSDLVLVVEARRRSGTYITVSQALEQGREVFAVPGRITDELSNGCHNLIRDGAGIATCAEDILEALKESGIKGNGIKENNTKEISRKENSIRESNREENSEIKKEKDLDAGENYILSLMDLTPTDTESLCQRTAGRYSYQELNRILIHLKIKGKVESIGNYYFKP